MQNRHFRHNSDQRSPNHIFMRTNLHEFDEFVFTVKSVLIKK